MFTIKTLGGTLLATTLFTGMAFADVPVLIFVAPTAGSVTEEGIAAVEAAVNPILEEKIGAHVDINLVPFADYNTRMTLMNSSREPYDIAMTAPWINNFFTNVTQGTLLSLNDVLPEVPELTGAVSDDLLSVATIDGNIYGVPIQQLFPKTFGVCVNKELAEKYDFDVESVESLADLTPVFERMVEGEGAGFYAMGGILAANAEMLGYDAVVGEHNYFAVVGLDDASLDIVNMYETDAYLELVNLRRAWHQAGLTDPNPMQRDAVRAALQAGTQAFSLDQCQDRPIIATFLGREFVAKSLSPLTLTTGAMNASMMAVSADSEHPIEALGLIASLHGDQEIFRLFAHGIEGVSYEIDPETGLITQLDGASEYWPSTDWMWGNSFLAAPRSEADIANAETAMATNAAATPAAALGFLFDIRPVELEMAALATLRPNFVALESGQVEDIEGYLAEQLQQLRDAGLDRVHEELARQLAAWQATR